MTCTVDEALALLDAVLPEKTEQQLAEEKERQLRQRLAALGVNMPNLGYGTETKGCGKCGGTMIRNYEQDDNGNRINVGPYICGSCGAVE